MMVNVANANCETFRDITSSGMYCAFADSCGKCSGNFVFTM